MPIIPAAPRRKPRRRPPPRRDRKARSPRAVKQAAYRWRVVNALTIYRVAVSCRVIDLLVRLRWLAEHEVGAPRKQPPILPSSDFLSLHAWQKRNFFLL